MIGLPTSWRARVVAVALVRIHHARMSRLIEVALTPWTVLIMDEFLSEASALDLTLVRSPVNYSIVCHGWKKP